MRFQPGNKLVHGMFAEKVPENRLYGIYHKTTWVTARGMKQRCQAFVLVGLQLVQLGQGPVLTLTT